MSCRVTFSHWGCFRGTLEPYRAWKLLDPPADIEEPGSELIEVAPDDSWDGCRFRVFGPTHPIRDLDDAEAITLFGGNLPEWPPEGEALRAIRAGIIGIQRHGAPHQEAMIQIVQRMAQKIRTVGTSEPSEDAEPEVAVAGEHKAYLRSLVPGPAFNMPLRPEDAIRGHMAALLAEDDVPGTPIRRGDIVLQLDSRRANPEPAGLRGLRLRVPRRCLATVADALDRLTVLELGRGPAWEHSVTELDRLLRTHQRPNWRDATSPLLIVRPVEAEEFTEAIVAESDEAALFELLRRVGGRMPAD